MSGKKALLAALAALGVLSGLALVIPFDAPGLGREVSERIHNATGIALEVSGARFNVLQGLVLTDLRASRSFVAGSLEVRVPRMVLEHRPPALLKGHLELTGVRLEGPSFHLYLVRRAGESAMLRNAAALETVEAREAWLDVEVALEAIRIEAGSLVVRDDISLDGLYLGLENLDYDRRALTPLHALQSRGSVAIEEAAVGNTKLRDLVAGIVTDRGRLSLQSLRFATDRGVLSGELAIDFNSFPFRYRTSLLAPSFEVEGVGRGTLRFEAEGFGTRARDLKGKGVFSLERGMFPDASWIREIDPALTGVEHEPSEIPFEVRDERLYLERFEIAVAGRALELEGSIGLDGSRDLRVNRRRD